MLGFGLFDWLKAIAAGIAVAVLAYHLGHWIGKGSAYQRLLAETAAAATRAEMERKGDDARLQSMSNFDLCVVGLRAQRMPVDACEHLRGVRPE